MGVSIAIGTEQISGDGGAATNASLNRPLGVAVDGSGNLFIADSQNNRIRKVDINGVITTVAGNGYVNPNLSALPLPPSGRCRCHSRLRPGGSARGSLAGLLGLAGGCRSAVWLSYRGGASGRAPGLARPGAERRLGVRQGNLWQLGTRFLRIAHQFAHASFHGALACKCRFSLSTQACLISGLRNRLETWSTSLREQPELIGGPSDWFL